MGSRTALVAIAMASCPLLAQAMCNRTNARQWDCTLVDREGGMAFSDIAKRVGVNPNKMCDFNRDEFPSCDKVPHGTSLRVPNDYPPAGKCMPKLGAWDCYVVQEGDTLDSIAHAPSSKMRSVSVLQMLNEDVLYNETQLYPGMQLRLPAFGEYMENSPFLPNVVSYACVEDFNFECHVVRLGEDLKQIAVEYDCSLDELLSANPKVLGGETWVVAGMEIRAPRRHKFPPVPCKTIPGFWGCYTVESGDSLFKIANKLGADPYAICNLNSPQVPNCTMLQIGQTLVYRDLPDCIPRPGYWRCYTVPRGAPYGAPLSMGTVASIANTSSVSGDGLGYGGSLIARYNQLQLCSHLDENRICTAAKEGGIVALVYPGMQLRMPIRHCFPAPGYKCESGYYMDIIGNYDFNQDTLANFKDNRAIAGLGGIPGTEFKVPTHLSAPEAWCRTSSCEWCIPNPPHTFCYKVQPNDTLAMVAEKQFYGIDWEKICKFNHMQNCSLLEWEDSFLKIPMDIANQAMPSFLI